MTRSSKDAGQVRTHSHRQKRTRWTHTVLGAESEVESGNPTIHTQTGVSLRWKESTVGISLGPRDAETFGHLWSRSAHSEGQSRDYWKPRPTKERMCREGNGRNLLPQIAMFSNRAWRCAWVALTGSALPVTAEAVICQPPSWPAGCWGDAASGWVIARCAQTMRLYGEGCSTNMKPGSLSSELSCMGAIC